MTPRSPRGRNWGLSPVARRTVTEHDITPNQAIQLSLAMAIVEEIHNGVVLAVIMQDKQGVFIHCRPGDEQQVMTRLAEVDWKRLRLLAEEYST